jgi:hypothetical protein
MLRGNWSLNHKTCPYGNTAKETGFTPRASKSREWIIERMKKYDGLINVVSSDDGIMARVGEYIYLPYSFMKYCPKVNFVKSGLQYGIIKEEDFTSETIMKLVNYQPQAMFGGTITSYQTEETPKLLRHLKGVFPDKYELFCSQYPELTPSEKELSHVGREAILSSLTPNVGEFEDCHKSKWIWDGEYLTSTNSRASFMLANKFSEIRIKPTGDVVVKITDDKQVNSNTVFKS